jgi:hypothetical protein
MNVDWSNNYVHDPRLADRRGYDFCAFMIRRPNVHIA